MSRLRGSFGHWSEGYGLLALGFEHRLAASETVLYQSKRLTTDGSALSVWRYLPAVSTAVSTSISTTVTDKVGETCKTLSTAPFLI